MTQQIRSRRHKRQLRPRGNIKIYQSFTTHRYTPSTCQIYKKWTVHEHKCLSSFLFFRFPSNWEREREREGGVYKIGYKEKWSQSLLIFFSLMELLWRIFLLLRVNRLYAIFNTGLKKMASSCPRYSSTTFARSTWLLFCPLRALSNNWLFLFSISADGKESPLPFWGPSQSFGFSLLPPGQAIHLGYYMSPKSGYWVQIACPNLLSCLNCHSPTACHC